TPLSTNPINNTPSFAPTSQSLVTLSALSSCILYNEPVLLIGETGVGKTHLIQHLSNINNKYLYIYNMSSDTDVSDLLGFYTSVHPISVIEEYVGNIIKREINETPLCYLERIERYINDNRETEGVNDSSKEEGVNDNRETEGVNDSSSNYKGVNDSSETEGVNDSSTNYKGVNDSSTNYKGVSNSTNNYHPFNNSTNNYHPFNNSTNNYNPLNNSTNYNPLNNSTNYNPLIPYINIPLLLNSIKECKILINKGIPHFKYQQGVMYKAMTEGKWLLLDEVNLSPKETLLFIDSIVERIVKSNCEGSGNNTPLSNSGINNTYNYSIDNKYNTPLNNSTCNTTYILPLNNNTCNNTNNTPLNNNTCNNTYNTPSNRHTTLYNIHYNPLLYNIHPNFRLFCCMNPPGIGKKDYKGILFSKIFMLDFTDSITDINILTHYLLRERNSKITPLRNSKLTPSMDSKLTPLRNSKLTPFYKGEEGNSNLKPSVDSNLTPPSLSCLTPLDSLPLFFFKLKEKVLNKELKGFYNKPLITGRTYCRLINMVNKGCCIYDSIRLVIYTQFNREGVNYIDSMVKGYNLYCECRLEGVSDKNDDYKGVSDKDMLEGVSYKNDDYKGFIDNNDDYKGVIDRSSNIKGVSDKNDDYKGVSDKNDDYKGVIDKDSNIKSVNTNTNTYHPLNNTNTYPPLNNTNTSHPFNNTFSLTSSNTRYIEILQLSIKYNLPILLQGPTCTGKTALITYISKINNTPLIRINNHNNITRADYIGTYQLINNTCTFIYGPLLHCMLKGCYLLLDELNLAPSEVLEVLNRVLDCNREIYVDEIQQTVKCSKGFRVFCTQNVMYGGRKGLSEALRNRFVEVTVEQLTLEDIESIVRGSIKGREGVGGVNDSSSNYKGVKDKHSNYKGVNDSSNSNYKGVNNSSSNYKGVNKSSSNYKGVNDSNCNYKGVGDSSSNYHPLNKCSNYHPLNKCSNYHPISNTTDTLHPLNNNNTIQHPLSTRIINKILSVYDSLRLYRNFNSLISIRDILRWVRRKGVSEEEVYENGVMLLFERQRNYMDRCVVKGVLDDVFRGVVRSRGVSNSTSTYHPVSNSTSNYHPVSNSSNNYHPFNNSTSTYHPFNNSTSTYHPVSNSSNNYHPFNNSSNTSFVLTPSYLRMYRLIYTAWINKEPILLIGETGIGKTKMLEYVSNLMGVNIETFSCNSNTQTHDFIGYYTLGKGSNEEGVSNSSRLECVNDKEYELEGVNHEEYELEGVSNSSMLEGVSNKDYGLEGVNDKGSNYKGVNVKEYRLEGINVKSPKQQGLNNSTNTLHPFSNIDSKQQGLSNSTN
ncbi:putative AAA ATPase, partial [Hamiltosporidium tvaerminnensis]